MLRQGVSSLNIRKLRANAGDKSTSSATEVAYAAVHNTKYFIPLEHPILDEHGVFYPSALLHHLQFDLTLAPVGDVLIFADKVIAPNYKLKNIELEYKCITSPYLSSLCESAYQNGRGFMNENVLLHKEFTIAKATVLLMNIIMFQENLCLVF